MKVFQSKMGFFVVQSVSFQERRDNDGLSLKLFVEVAGDGGACIPIFSEKWDSKPKQELKMKSIRFLIHTLIREFFKNDEKVFFVDSAINAAKKNWHKLKPEDINY